MVPQYFLPDNRVNEIIQIKLRQGCLFNDDLHRRCEKKEEANHFVKGFRIHDFGSKDRHVLLCKW